MQRHTSLELSRQLKEAGLKQDWASGKKNWIVPEPNEELDPYLSDYFGEATALDLTDILEEIHRLNPKADSRLTTVNPSCTFSVWTEGRRLGHAPDAHDYDAEPVEAAGKVLLALLKAR